MENKTLYPDCYKCGRIVDNREDQALIRFEGEEILFQRVPMGVCTGCGERFLTSKIALRMERAMVLCRSVSDPTSGEIRTFREALNLSREAFASKLGVSGQSVFRWESGRSHPRRWVVQRMESLRKKTVKKRLAS